MKQLKNTESKLQINDPRPDWMREFHDSVKDGSKRYKEWVRQTMTINIDKQLAYDAARGKSGKAQQVVEAITNQQPFILYQDGKRWAIVIPKLKSVVQFFPDKSSTVKVLEERQFQNEVKFLYVLFPNFEHPTPKTVQNILAVIITQFKPVLQLHV